MMKKRGLSKRILAFVLSVMMVLALVPMNAITVKAEGVPDCPHCGGTGFVCSQHNEAIHFGEEYANNPECDIKCEKASGNGNFCETHGYAMNLPCEYCERNGHTCDWVYEHFVDRDGTNFHSGDACSMCGKYSPEYGNVCNTSGENGACSYCGFKAEAPAHTHTKDTHHAPVAATCTNPGVVEYWDCCSCGAKIDVNEKVIEDITIPRKKVITSAIDTNSNGFKGEGCENLLDSNTDTKWCCSFDGETFVVIKASEPVIISNYTITTAGDTSQYKDRNPKSWTLLACNDYNEAEKKGTWEEIDSISNGDMPNKNTTAKTFNISSTKKYQYYKWTVTSIVGGPILQVSEFELNAFHSFENNDANTHKCSFCNTTGEHDFSDGTCKGVCTVCGASNTSGTHDLEDEIVITVNIDRKEHHLKYDDELYFCQDEGCDAEFEPGYYNAYGSCEENDSELAYVLLANKEDLEHIQYDGCLQLQVVDFRNIEEIEGFIEFKDCKLLQTVNLGRLQKSKRLENAIVFENCPSLQSVDLKNLTEVVSDSLGIFFDKCGSLETIDLGSLKNAGGDLDFRYCDSLETIDLGSLKNVGGHLDFRYCDSLRAVDLGKLVNCGDVTYSSAKAASVTLHEGDPCGIKTDFWDCVISYTSHTYILDEEGHYVCSVCGHEGGCATGNHDFLDEGSANYNGEKCSLCNVKNIAYPDLDIKAISTTYNDAVQTAVITGIEAENYTVTGNTATNAGKYTITLTGKGDYTGTREVEWTIMKATPMVDPPPTPTETKYSGECVALLNPGTTDFGKLLYRTLEEESFSETIPCVEEPGDYLVYYMVEGGENWEEYVPPEPILVTVELAPQCTITGNHDFVAIEGDSESHKCSVCGAIEAHDTNGPDGSCSKCGTSIDGIKIKSMSLELDPENGAYIGVNLYADAPEDAEFYLDDAPVELVKDDKTGLYKIQFRCAAKEFADTRKLVACDSIGCSIMINGVDEFTYSGKSYCDKVLANKSDYSAELKEVCSALNDFNAQTRNYFKYNTDGLNVSNVAANIPSEGYESSSTGKLPEDSSYMGSSLILRDEIVLRHYFVGDLSSEVIACKNKASNKAVEVKFGTVSDNITYVDIAAPYSHISDMYELSIGEGETAYTLTYGVLTYCNKAYEKNPNSELVNTCNAMYNYSVATNKYFKLR